MKRETCPYLGLQDDPTTALLFPSEGNYCHHARPIAPVQGSFQQKYCLTGEHRLCPVYQASKPVPLPAGIASPVYNRAQGRRILALLGIPVLIAGVAFLTLLWNTFGVGMLMPKVIPDTGKGSRITFGSNLSGLDAAMTPTPFQPSANNAGSAPLPTKLNCPLPQGWVPYTVSPTDSLFRLSVVYGVSVEELQRVNCMGNETVILPDQIIYVPYIPTDTPVFPDTPVPNQPATAAPPVINQPVTPRPNTNTPVPATAVHNTPTIPASATPLPTSTSIPATLTPLPSATATATVQPTFTQRPTKTPKRPTATSIFPTLPFPTLPFPTFPPPATSTPVPPATSTPIPPATSTPIPPPTSTPVPPPTSTPPPPTNTSAPPPTSPPPPTSTSQAVVVPTSTSPPPAPTDTSAPPPPTSTSAPASTSTSAPASTNPSFPLIPTINPATANVF